MELGRQLFSERKTQAVTIASARFFGAIETIEDVGHIFFCNTWTLITYGNFGVFKANGDGRFLRAIFDGIFDQNSENFGKGFGIAIDFGDFNLVFNNDMFGFGDGGKIVDG